MKAFVVYLFFFCWCGKAVAQKENSVIIKSIADEVLTHSTAYENLRVLCKQVGPRLSGSAGAAKAITYTTEMMKKTGADTVYLQPCYVTHWVRGAKEKGYVIIDGQKFPLNLTALGNSVGTGKKGIKAEIIEVKSMQALEQLGTSVAGKIVFFNIPMNPTYVQTFMAYGESGIGRRSGPAAAAHLGAIGVIVRSLSSNPDDYPHTGTTVYDSTVKKIPAIAISTNNADWLSKRLVNGKKAEAYFQTNCMMFPPVLSYNVIGEIKGTEYPEEIITVGGHLDSWDLAEGASDDGTGCVQSMDVLRTIKSLGLRPKRTIRAVLFMNEENGGGGGTAYLDSAVSKKEMHLLAMESDAGGFTPRFLKVDATSNTLEFFKQWQPLFAPYGIQSIDAGGGGSDIGPLKKLGTALVGYAPDGQRYFDIHHAATDIFEQVSKRELELGVVNMTAFLYLVAQQGIKP